MEISEEVPVAASIIAALRLPCKIGNRHADTNNICQKTQPYKGFSRSCSGQSHRKNRRAAFVRWPPQTGLKIPGLIAGMDHLIAVYGLFKTFAYSSERAENAPLVRRLHIGKNLLQINGVADIKIPATNSHVFIRRHHRSNNAGNRVPANQRNRVHPVGAVHICIRR